MVKLIVGLKGTGKTKTLIDLVNKATEESKGAVICIEKGSKLNYDITHKARLIDTESFLVGDAQALYGFIAGITASNHDITDIFVDSALKICQNDSEGFDKFLDEMNALVAKLDINVVMTSSIPSESASDTVKKYI